MSEATLPSSSAPASATDATRAAGDDVVEQAGHGSGHGHDPYLAHHFHSRKQQFATEKLGIWLFLATEILMFGGLFCLYAFYRGLHPEIFLYGHQFLPTHWGAINTAVLLTSSLTMAWAVRAAQVNAQTTLKLMLVATLLGGVGFMVIKGIEYTEKFSHDLWPGPANLYYPIAEEAADPEQAEAEKLSEIQHLEAYYGIGAHGGGYAAAGDTHGEETHGGETRGGETGGGETAGDAASAAEAQTGGQASGDAADASGEAEPRLMTGALPEAEQSTLKAPAAPTGGVNAAYLDPAAEAEHKSYTFTQLPEIERDRMHMFFQIYYLMTGLHGIHVLVGMGLIGWLAWRAFGGAFHDRNFAAVDVVGLYWHLVDLIWIFLFPLLYLIH